MIRSVKLPFILMGSFNCYNLNEKLIRNNVTIIIIPTIAHTHLSLPHEVFSSLDRATHYHVCGPKLGAVSVTRHLAGLGVKLSFFNHNLLCWV
jgi:hypothetical protein